MKATPRPFYRWKSFWLGLFVLVFLGWAWVRSMWFDDTVTWGSSSGDWGVSLSHHSSRMMLGIQWKYELGPFPVGFDHYPRELTGDEMSRELFPEAIARISEPAVYEELIAAHWFLILLFLVPWSAWLFVYWKREQRKLTA